MYTSFWGENSPEYEMDVSVFTKKSRFKVERQKLASAWNTVLVDPAYGQITSITGSIEPILGGPIRDFQIIVPRRYPYECPHSFPVGWYVDGPHCYPLNNEMCLWLPNDWSARLTLAYAVSKTFVWIHKFEEWQRSGIWPGNQQPH